MKENTRDRSSERGSAAVKFLAIFVVLILAANAGYQYVPVAYQGASFKQEMDTAVVKGLAASGQMKPLEVVQAHIKKAAYDYQIPNDAVIDVKVVQGVYRAQVSYQKDINMLPFGIYKYKYDFNYTATPQGYLLKEN